MAVSTPRKLLADIKAGEFQPLYYFYGPEGFRMVEAEKYIAGRFLPDRQLRVNYRRLDGRRTKVADLLAELSVYPLLGERQVIALTDVQSYKPKEIDRILKILTPPDSNRIVILSSPPQRTPKRKSAFLTKITKAASTVEFKRLHPDETAGIAMARLKKAGLEIEPEALRILSSLVDGNRGALEGEIEKLVNFRPDSGLLTVEDIRKITAGYQAYTVFQLADEVVGGDRASVLKLVRQLLAEGSSATGMLYFLGQHLITLSVVKQGKSLEPYRNWLLPKFRAQAERFTAKRLEQSIIAVAEADARLRREGLKPVIILDQLVLELMAD